MPRCRMLSMSRVNHACVCSESCTRQDNRSYICGARPSYLPVPTRTPKLPRLDASGRVALQMSGHLGNTCDLRNALRHKQACESVFSSCVWHIHTWNETEPTTPHWSGWERRPSRPLDSACLDKVRTLLRPVTLQVEVQPPPPPNKQPPPQVRSKRDPLRDPARAHGWEMNLLGMRRAATLRRRELSAIPYQVAVRLRPDGKEVPYSRLTYEKTLRLWQCIALTAHGPNASQPNDALLRLHPCDPAGSLDETGQDNCFFGAPSAMDLVLRTLGRPGTARRQAVQVAAIRQRIRSWHPERLIAIAAHMASIDAGTACHIDTLRYVYG